MKKWITWGALVLALALPLTGCKLIQINPERDAAVVVAKVGDRVITKAEFYERWNVYRSQLGITDEIEASSTYADTIDGYKTALLDQMVTELVVVIQSENQGYFNLTDEEKQEVQTDIDDLLASLRTSAEEEFTDEDMTDEERTAAVDARVAELREEYGYTDEYLNTMYTKQVATNKLYEQITGDIAPTEEYVQEAYTELLSEHEETYATDTDAYIEAYLNGNPPLYTPSGIRLVQQILIKLPDTITTQLTTLRSEDLTDEADALLETELAKIYDTAQEVVDKLAAGEDYADLMAEYNEDTDGAASYPDGYPVATGTTQYYDAFTTAAMALTEVGETSDLVATDYGYHILRYNKSLPEGDVSYEDARESVMETAEESMKEDAWNEQVSTWSEALGTKTYYARALEALTTAKPTATPVSTSTVSPTAAAEVTAEPSPSPTAD